MSLLAVSNVPSKWAKPAILGLVALLLVLVIYKVATFKVEVPKPQFKAPLADCTKRVEVGELWADPLALKCGRAGEEGKLRSCLRVLYAPGFEKLRTCFDPKTLGRSQEE